MVKPSTGYWKLIIVLLVLALAQFACNFGVHPANPTSQPPTATSVPQTAQPAATDTPQSAQPTSSAGSKYGTPDEAKAMLQKAIAHYNSVGRDKALSDFTNKVAPFFDRDLYVACIDSNLTQSANGGFPDLVGSPIQPLSRSAWDAATTTAINSVDYNWIDPATGQTLPKKFYYEKVGSDVCGVGAYSP